MGGKESEVDRDLLGRVAALTPSQQRWLKTVIQSVFTIDLPDGKRPARELAVEPDMEIEVPPPLRSRRRREERPPAEEPPPRKRRGLDELLSGEGISEEDYPELTEELRGIAEIADMLREGGSERRRVGEELMRLLGKEDKPAEDGEEESDDDSGASLN